MPHFFQKHFRYLFILILMFAAFTRLYRLDEPKTYVFDEVYHAVTSKLIYRNDLRAFEWWNLPVEPNTAVDWLHPPLAKYTQALGIAIFGENTFGWRVSSAVFGILVIAATMKLADQLFHQKRVTLLAGTLASLDGLLLVQSRIAMNDIHVTFFILLTLICYLRYRQPLPNAPSHRSLWWLFLTGLSAGLAMATKWSGIYVLGLVCLAELVSTFWPIFVTKKKFHFRGVNLRKLLFTSLVLFALPPLIYVLSYFDMFLQGKTLVCEDNRVLQGQCYCRQDSSYWVSKLTQYAPLYDWQKLEARGGCKRLISHFSELHHQILWYQTHLSATHFYQSRPLEWFLDLRPVWYYTQSTTTITQNIYTFGNPLLFWFGDVAIAATLIYLIIHLGKWLFRHQKLSPYFGMLLFLFSSYLIVWLPWQLSPRIMFFYHYTPAVPLLCILLAYWLTQLGKEDLVIKKKKIKLDLLPYLILGSIFICFLLWFPHWTNLPMPSQFAESLYFALPNWK